MALKTVVSFLKNVDELKTAETLLDTFSKYSDNILQIDELSNLYYEVKAYEKSAEKSEKALTMATKPEEVFAVRSNLAKIYNHLNEPQKALNNICQNLPLVQEGSAPYYEMKMEEIFSIYLLGKHNECEEKLKEMLKQDLPENIRDRVNFNLGTYEMERGMFKEGFAKFTRGGRKVGVFKKINPPANIKEWDGKIDASKKLLVLHRGGIGDEIINIRFMNKIGMEYVWVCSNKHLVPVFKRNGFNVVSSIKEVGDLNEHMYCSSMDLPYLLGLDKEDLGREAYLKPSEEYLEKWKDINGGVGIKWSGNPYYEHDLHRSLLLDDIMSVLGNRNGVYSLQKENYNGVEEYSNVIDLHEGMETIEDTLAIIWNLDFVITSCTSIAHMAASMGKKVFVLPPISCYYVWLGRKDGKSDWYGDWCTVIRQSECGKWDNELKILKDKIKENVQ